MLRRSVALLLALAALLAAPTPSLAVGTLDQSQEDFSWDRVVANTLAQTFTTSIAGALDQVEIHMGARPAGLDNSAVVEIHTTSGGLPTSLSLWSKAVTLTTGWNTVVFSEPIVVEADTQYAIVVRSTGDGLQWHGTCAPGAYPGGEALINDGAWKTFAQYVTDHSIDPPVSDAYCGLDFAFRTYVNPDDLAVNLDIAPATVPADAPSTVTVSISITNTGIARTSNHVLIISDADFNFEVPPEPVETCVAPGGCVIAEGWMDFGILDAGQTATWSVTGTFDPSADSPGDTHVAIIGVCIGEPLVQPNLRRAAGDGTKEGDCWIATAEFTIAAAEASPSPSASASASASASPSASTSASASVSASRTPAPHITPPPTSGHSSPDPGATAPLIAALALAAAAAGAVVLNRIAYRARPR